MYNTAIAVSINANHRTFSIKTLMFWTFGMHDTLIWLLLVTFENHVSMSFDCSIGSLVASADFCLIR